MTTSYNDSGLINRTTYYYVVSAIGGGSRAGVLPPPRSVPGLPQSSPARPLSFSLGNAITRTFGDVSFANPATASSRLAVTYGSDKPEVAAVNPSTGEVTIKGAGTAHLLANQPGNASFTLVKYCRLVVTP